MLPWPIMYMVDQEQKFHMVESFQWTYNQAIAAQTIKGKGAWREGWCHTWRFSWRGRCVGARHACSILCQLVDHVTLFFLGSRQLSHLWTQIMTSHAKKTKQTSTNSSKYAALQKEIGKSEEKTFWSLFLTPHNRWRCGHGVWRGPGGSIDLVVAFVEQPHDRQGCGHCT